VLLQDCSFNASMLHIPRMFLAHAINGNIVSVYSLSSAFFLLREQ